MIVEVVDHKNRGAAEARKAVSVVDAASRYWRYSARFGAQVDASQDGGSQADLECEL